MKLFIHSVDTCFWSHGLHTGYWIVFISLGNSAYVMWSSQSIFSPTKFSIISGSGDETIAWQVSTTSDCSFTDTCLYDCPWRCFMLSKVEPLIEGLALVELSTRSRRHWNAFYDTHKQRSWYTFTVILYQSKKFHLHHWRRYIITYNV